MLTTRTIEKRLWDLQRFGLTPRKIVRRAFGSGRPLPIFAATIPKSGTHLLERSLCLHPEISRKLVRKLFDRNIDRHGGWRHQLGTLGEGQVLLAHPFYSDALACALEAHGIATIVMVRDPRAMVLSQAHYIARNRKHELHAKVRELNLRERVRFVLEEILPFDGTSYPGSLVRFAELVKLPKAFVVKYETLASADMNVRTDELERIWRHVGVNFDQNQLEQGSRHLISDVSPTFRSGTTGGWEQELTAEEMKAILEITGPAFAALGYALESHSAHAPRASL